MNRRFALIAACACLPPRADGRRGPRPSLPRRPRPPPPRQRRRPSGSRRRRARPPSSSSRACPRVKGEIQTKIKVKNTSKGSIALLSVEEIWYNSKREIASNGIYRHKQLLNPGDIIEFIISSPEKPDLEHEHADVQARQRHDQAEPRSKKLP